MIMLPNSVILSLQNRQREGRNDDNRKAEAPKDDATKSEEPKATESAGQSDAARPRQRLRPHAAPRASPLRTFNCTQYNALHPSAPSTIRRSAPRLRRKSKALPTCCIRAMPPKRRKARFRGPSCCFLCSAICAWCCGAIRQRSRQQPQPRPLREPRRPRQQQWRPRSRQPSQPRQQPSWRTPRHALP